MKFLLFYKGNYGVSLKGPEMRYLGLANALAAQGHQVSIAGKNFDQSVFPKTIKFVSISHFFAMLKSFISADCIVLHGGGPFILLASLLSSFLGKKVVLDGYVPHWIELDEVMFNQGACFKLRFKSMFNAFRALMALHLFDMVIVANQRQQDLMRGMMAPFTRTEEFARIKIIPFGCDPYIQRSRDEGIKLLNSLSDSYEVKSEDFLVGWLGGTYGWFDLGNVLSSMEEAFKKNPKIKLVFFGVDNEQRENLLSHLSKAVHSNLIFFPWVPFQERFSYWAAFDLSLVWGGQGYENDYASRTRNFDCLSLGLPVIQNKDDEWGERLVSNKCGVVTSADTLSADVLFVSRNPELLRDMKMAMANLAPEFYWSRFSEKMILGLVNNRMNFGRRLLGVFSLMLITPSILMFFLYGLFRRTDNKE